jgi:mxaK protein
VSVRRAGDAALGLVLAVSLIAAGTSGFLLWRGAQANHTIALLAEGKDIPVPHDDLGPLQAARARFLLRQGRFDAASAIADRMVAGGDPVSRASLLYALGNAHLRRALDAFKTDPMRQIAPIINVAKSEYREALSIDPQNWDARYNYDIGAALVRDADGAPPNKGADMARERALWPDIPGAPNGLP